MNQATLYLLDTNILIHYVRASPVWQQIRNRYSPLTMEPRPLVSVVSEGEIQSLALQWNWGEKSRSQMEFALDYFRIVTIQDIHVIRAYAVIDAYCESIGQSMGKNDLWIAATAIAAQATLLTTDKDFDRLAPHFLNREWINPVLYMGDSR